MLKKALLFVLTALTPLATYSYDVAALGGMVLDHMFEVDHAFLKEMDGSLHGSAEASYEEFTGILSQLPPNPMLIHGGSSLNMLGALALLGRDTKFFTSCGIDELGRAHLDSLDERNIDYKVALSEQRSGATLCLVTPDGERTIRWIEDCREALDRLYFSPADFNGACIAHIEGYRCANQKLVRRYAKAASGAGCWISMDLGSHEMVQAFRPFFEELISDYAQILFANADEARLLTGKEPFDACASLARDGLIVVVTSGANGCYVSNGSHVQHVPAHVCTPVDTTGAGDFFAAGFLHGLLLGLPVDACAESGHILASRCVQNLGAYISKDQLVEAAAELEALVQQAA